MKPQIFSSKAEEFGDFYVFYPRPDTAEITFAVATSDLSTPYIKTHKRFKSVKTPVAEGFVRLWDWKSDRLLDIEVSTIKKVVPLQSVLQNDRLN